MKGSNCIHSVFVPCEAKWGLILGDILGNSHLKFFRSCLEIKQARKGPKSIHKLGKYRCEFCQLKNSVLGLIESVNEIKFFAFVLFLWT